MDLIAYYESVWFEGHYKYDLHANALHITGTRFLESKSSQVIPLVNLQPRNDRVWLRSNYFWVGVGIAFFSFVTLQILVTGLGVDPLSSWPGLLAFLVAVGVGTSAATFRMNEFAIFYNDGGFPALSIARSRRSSQSFHDFVEKVIVQIRRCKGLTSSDPLSEAITAKPSSPS
jgi:hypothetical protein